MLKHDVELVLGIIIRDDDLSPYIYDILTNKKALAEHYGLREEEVIKPKEVSSIDTWLNGLHLKEVK